MPAFTSAQLLSEITSDPASLGYAAPVAVGNQAGIAALLNDPTKGLAMPKPVPMLAFAKFAAGSGMRQKLKNGQSNETVGAICDTAIEMLGQLTISFDPNDVPTQQMMAALVTASVLTSTDQTTIVTNCTQPSSRAENLWGIGVTVQLSDVAAAINSQV